MVLLNDNIFALHGGDIDGSNQFQRGIAYSVAESMVSAYLGAPLEPTHLSGTFNIPPDHKNIVLTNSYLTSILEVGYVFLNEHKTISNSFLLSYADEYGIIPFKYIYDYMNYCWPDDNRLFVSYLAGMPTGTFSNPMYMQGLVIVAQNVLFEISDPSSLESGPGDVGIRSFANNGYSENRFSLINTIFGNSAAVQKVRKYFAPIRRIKGLVI